jgi:hypothetical protein
MWIIRDTSRRNAAYKDGMTYIPRSAEQEKEEVTAKLVSTQLMTIRQWAKTERVEEEISREEVDEWLSRSR